MTLKEIAELTHRQLFPTANGRAAVTLPEFVRTAVVEYAYQSLLLAWKDKKEEGVYEVPSYLLKSVEKDVIGNAVDISDLDTFKSLPMEAWLQGVEGNGCRYIKTTYNNVKILADETSLPNGAKTFYAMENIIKFPKGASKTVVITYAGKGSAKGELDVDDAIAAVVRQRLVDIYGGKTGAKDETNNENTNN